MIRSLCVSVIEEGVLSRGLVLVGERDVWMAIMSGLMIMSIRYGVPIALLSVLPTCLVGVTSI